MQNKEYQYFYRPQTKFGEGNVFTSMYQEFCPELAAATETRTVGKRAVRTLLECFLVPGYDQFSL